MDEKSREYLSSPWPREHMTQSCPETGDRALWCCGRVMYLYSGSHVPPAAFWPWGSGESFWLLRLSSFTCRKEIMECVLYRRQEHFGVHRCICPREDPKNRTDFLSPDMSVSLPISPFPPVVTVFNHFFVTHPWKLPNLFMCLLIHAFLHSSIHSGSIWVPAVCESSLTYLNNDGADVTLCWAHVLCRALRYLLYFNFIESLQRPCEVGIFPPFFSDEVIGLWMLSILTTVI